MTPKPVLTSRCLFWHARRGRGSPEIPQDAVQALDCHETTHLFCDMSRLVTVACFGARAGAAAARRSRRTRCRRWTWR